MSSEAPVKIYCALMEELKDRTALIRRFCNGSLSVGHNHFNYECVSLQLRKVLELIAFGSLCANKTKYAKVYANFEKHWNAKRLLKDLGRVHPDFYPKPIYLVQTKEGSVKHFDNVSDGFLTKGDFVNLYGKCSQVIHTPNPFSQDEQSIDFGFTFSQWFERIQRLLNLHLMRLADMREVWVVYMAHPTDGRVHAFIASPQPTA